MNKNYRAFINKRDEALERILKNTRLRMTEILDRSFNSAISIIQRDYKGLSNLYHPLPQKHRFSIFEKHLNDIFEIAVLQLTSEIFDMRRKAYTLANVGESTALGSNKSTSSKYEIDQWIYAEGFESVSVMKKIDVWFNKLRRSILNEVEYSVMTGEEFEMLLFRVFKKLPKRRPIKQARSLKKLPKKVREAGLINISFQDSEVWNDILKDYLEDYVPTDRSPESFYDIVNPHTGEVVPPDKLLTNEDYYYEWEIERDTTHDFVKQVREGQIDAANANGITDFVVISVLDEKTCEKCCGDVGCYDFNGKTTSEVKKMTKGENEAPPYHFSCRCSIEPYTDDMEKVNITQIERDFDEWINSQ